AIHQRAIGKADLGVDVDWKANALAKTWSQISLDGRNVTLSSFKADVLGGKANGQGTVDLDHPYQADALIDMTRVGAGNLADVAPDLADLRGAYSGQVRLMPATGSQPLEPLEVQLDISPTAAAYRTVQFGHFRLRGFLGPERFVLENRPEQMTRLDVA